MYLLTMMRVYKIFLIKSSVNNLSSLIVVKMLHEYSNLKLICWVGK